MAGCARCAKLLIMQEGRLSELCQKFVTSGTSEDDPYLILAALHSGEHCFFLSNDFMRQHCHALGRVNPELARLFMQWQCSHQVT